MKTKMVIIEMMIGSIRKRIGIKDAKASFSYPNSKTCFYSKFKYL
ncbi:MAG: hypothetical protein ACJAYP_001377 [Flavobacterium sp.]|jgi:hypothetical protein